jgi:hypothetical protein
VSEAAAATSHLARLRDGFEWALSCLQLQLGRQLTLVVVLDVVLVGLGLVDALVGPDSPAAGLYTGAFLVPLFALGVPALADLVALERRAGCLDLALAAPAGELYFLRRAGVVVALLAAQGTLVMGLTWVVTGGDFPLLTVEGQLLAVTAFTGAAAIFWAVRLGSAGSVWLATMATVVATARWTFWVPVVTAAPGQPRVGKLLPSPWNVWEWATRALPLVVAGTLLVLYARRRLRRPELLLGSH